jgi:Asp-tRNA(Asn)/Glu-tRNA(Gln) amidotransferase A subunit family amidase
MTELARRCAAAVAAREPDVAAFAWWDTEDLLARARIADGIQGGALRGLPIGIKDIIDTAGIPTERGSRLFAGRVPERSAAIVERLEAQGAVLAGKTVTAELAHAAPGPARNPWNAERTPGGSSMGSAAAVGAGMLPAALGTQTNSSVIMPATLCGAVGYKPTGGSTDLEGVMAFSESLDELGCFGATVADVAVIAPWLGDALRRLPSSPARVDAGALRIGVAHGPGWPKVALAVADRLEAVAGALGELERLEAPWDLGSVAATHRTIMAYEGNRNLGAAVRERPDAVHEITRVFFERGAAIGDHSYRGALAARDRVIEAYDTFVEPFDVILTTAAPDEAPGRAGTGDARCCTVWTLAGAPAVALPCGGGPQGLPIGVQLVGRRGKDASLLAAAAAIEYRLARSGGLSWRPPPSEGATLSVQRGEPERDAGTSTISSVVATGNASATAGPPARRPTQ